MTVCSHLWDLNFNCTVQATPEKRLIAFRGTDSVNDWRINFKMATRFQAAVRRDSKHGPRLCRKELCGWESRATRLVAHWRVCARLTWHGIGGNSPKSIWSLLVKHKRENWWEWSMDLKPMEAKNAPVNNNAQQQASVKCRIWLYKIKVLVISPIKRMTYKSRDINGLSWKKRFVLFAWVQIVSKTIGVGWPDFANWGHFASFRFRQFYDFANWLFPS